MKKIFTLLGILAIGVGSLVAQRIIGEKTFTVNYPINSIGYPSKILKGGESQFIYMEYWEQGEGRRYPNDYTQCYTDGFEEVWFAPLTRQGERRLLVQDMFRMNNSVAVVGDKYLASVKRQMAHIQFYDLKGKPLGGLQKVAKYDKKCKKGYQDEMSTSSDGSCFLWMGHNPTAKNKKRRAFFNVFRDNGRPLWGRSLSVPHLVSDKYKIKQSNVDKKGNVYLLLTYEVATNTLKDTLNLPIILRYDYREKKFAEYKLEIPHASVQESQIYMNREGELVFTGIISDGSEKGFLNGAKSSGVALKWNKIIYKKFKVERDLTLVQDYTLDMPESWLDRYGKRGANFSKANVMEYKGKLYWILEEFYTQIHNGQNQFLFYDVATVAIDMENGTIDWASFFEKKQRDYNSGRMLSYVPGIASGKLNFVYLNERGAQGAIVCTAMDLQTGKHETKKLVSNEKAAYLFFPRRSGMIDDHHMLLMGVGNPVGNDYKLIKIAL